MQYRAAPGVFIRARTTERERERHIPDCFAVYVTRRVRCARARGCLGGENRVREGMGVSKI